MAEKKLNIAMFGHKHIPSREGGIEVVVGELSTRMVQRGYSVVVYNRKGHHISGEEFDTKRTENYHGVRIKEVYTIDRRGLAAMTSSVFASLATAFGKFDVVHIHAEGPAFMCWLPKMLGKKVVVTIHGLDWARAKWGRFASWYIKTGEKMAVKYADEIIVLSHGVKEYFWKQYQRRTRFIPNGVNKPEIRRADKIKAWGLKKDEYVLFVGRLVPEKGLRYLVRAWKDINTDKKLVIAGGSSNSDIFLEELKSMSGDGIIYTGFVQGRILEELYSNAYVYVLPSDLEGMPLSLLEAMSYGNCCLTSDIAECFEVVEDKAITFKKSSVADLREKLKELLDRPEEVKKYKDEAADFILVKYGWNDVVDRTLRLYR